MRPVLPLLAALATVTVLAVGSLACAPEARAESPSTQVDAVSAVDPFIGTEETVSINEGNARGNAAYGNTVPGATVPFGMVQNSPATFQTKAVNSDIGNTRGGYEYNADTIRGFGLTRLSGTGCSGRFGGFDVPILPFTGALEAAAGPGGATLPTNPASDIGRYRLPFSHDRESAEPGYYSVTTDNGVTTELTATVRAAVDRFTFPSGDPGSDTLIIDAAGSNNDISASHLTIDPDTRTVSGSVTAKIVCATGPSYTAYFSATFDQPFESFGTWSEAAMTAGGTAASSTTRKHGAGAWLTFADGTEVTARIGLSYVSEEGAAGNASTETGSRNFDTVRSLARHAWAEALGTVDARGGSAEANTKFYTALYHALGNPNVFEDADGRYTGYDDQIHRVRDGHHFYVNFSGWDTYRGQAQLVALLEPHVASDINQSIVDMVDQSGKWSSWPSYNRVQTKMSGDSLQVIVAATDGFGATDYDRGHALASMVDTQSVPNAATASNRSDAFLYTTLGWVSGDSKNAATSRTLEYATDDFAIAQLARRLGDTDAQALFSQRSQNWMNVFNPVRHHIDARNKNGFMNVALNTQGDQFEQSTGKQYGFSVPFNMHALIEARGGIARATADLDSMLEHLDAGAFSEYAYMTNQPSFGLPWVYNWLRSPVSTTDTLDRAVGQLFGSGPDGLLGNDDLGSLSSWYVWANLGLFPGIYGTADLLVSSPMFEQITIRSADSDRQIVISAPGATQGARHIETLNVDGVEQTASWLPENFARNGGTLQFAMTSARTSSWGTAEGDVPPSYPEGTDDPNGRGITHDGARDAGSLDAGGATLSYEKLASKGITPGASLPFGDTGVTFTWPGSADGAHPDHFIPHGQRLDVANVSTTGISFLGLATNGPSTGDARVVYTDGSTQVVTVSLSDWTPSNVPAGNTALVELQGRNTREGGSDTAKPKVFATDVAGLDSSKVVDAVILPTSVDKGIMHIFAVGFRNPMAAGAEATRTSLSFSPATLTEGESSVANVSVSPNGVAGTVTLSENATVLGSSPVASDGTARIAVPGTLGAGSHTIVAAFSPDDTGLHLPSASPGVVLTVQARHTVDARGSRWTRTYESGTPAPAGFPQHGQATGIRGESVVQPGQIAEVTSNAPNTGNIKEYVARLADGDRSTKWYAAGTKAPSQTNPVIAAYALTEAQAVTGYSVTAAADSSSFPERDPRTWQVLASDAPDAVDDLTGPSWKVVSAETDQTFAANGLTRFYRITDAHPHSAYQLRVSANAGGTTKNATTQIADWTLSTDDGDSPRALGVSVRQTGTVPGGAGVQALRYAGRILGDGPVDSSTVLQMGLDVTVTEGTTLSYLLRPDDQTSTPVSVDVVYSVPGSAQDVTLPGKPVSAPPGRWTPVSVDLSSLAGARIHELRLHYREDSGVADSLVSGWIDSLTVGAPLVDDNTVWTYLDVPDVDPAAGATDRTAWTTTVLPADAGWKQARGPFGAKRNGTDLGSGYPVTTRLNLYKDATSAPVLEGYFLRTSFTLDQDTVDTGVSLSGTVVFDDTATVYVNGTRIAGWDDSEITKNLQYQTPQGTDGGGDPETRSFTVPASVLVAGENTVAVEVHQCNATSSDVYFAMPTLELAADGASTPFGDELLRASYPSDSAKAPDGSDYHTWLLRSFNDALGEQTVMGPNTPYEPGTTVAQLSGINDATVVAVNNTPTSYADKLDPEVEEALRDGAGSPYVTMSNGLGDVIGPLFTQALANNELPKTKALLSYRVEKPTANSGDPYQTAKNTYQYKRPFVRMGFTSTGGLLKKWDSDSGYAGLTGDGSFPSGHTSHGYSQGITLATLLPELGPQILARTSEYGNNRIVLSFHYPTDVMGGRIVGEDITARRWSDAQYRPLLEAAREELDTVLAQKCREVDGGDTLQECIAHQNPYLDDKTAVDIYTQRLTYGFPQVGPTDLAPEVPSDAADLLLTRFPALDAAQRTTVLAATSLPSGFVLDETGGAGSFQRLNLAAAMDATVEVSSDGALVVNGVRVGADGLPLDPVGPIEPGTPTAVTPGEVLFTDEDGSERDTFTIPDSEGVDYLVGADVLPAGTYPATGTVSVTARAREGYALVEGATAVWTHVFSSANTDPTGPVRPTDPTEPSDPGWPTGPGQPTDSGQPTDADHSTDPTGPGTPTGTVSSATEEGRLASTGATTSLVAATALLVMLIGLATLRPGRRRG